MKQDAQYRLWRGSRLADKIQRLRFFRGHGVHSPFVFAIVRNVFMCKGLKPEALEIADTLKVLETKRSVITELANLAYYCQNSTVVINELPQQTDGLVIATKNCNDSTIKELAKSAEQNGTPLVIMEPYRRRTLCDALLKDNRSSSIDRFSYMIFFNNHLPKQHFKL